MSEPAPSNPNPDPTGGGGNPDPGGGGGNPDPNANPDPGSTGDLDLTKLEGDQLAKVLENPNLFKLPRVAELLQAQKDLKALKDQKAADDQKSLEEQGKFKELAETRATEVSTLKEQIQTMTIDQALTTKLVPEGVVDIDAALKLADRSKVKIDDNGNVTGLDEAIASLKTDKAYLFGKGSNPTVGGPTNPGTNPSGPAKFKRSQLQDANFYNEHRTEILAAQKAGLIEDDISGPKQ